MCNFCLTNAHCAIIILFSIKAHRNHTWLTLSADSVKRPKKLRFNSEITVKAFTFYRVFAFCRIQNIFGADLIRQGNSLPCLFL